MRISSVEAYILQCPLDAPYGNSLGWTAARTATLVRIETDDGQVGWGECGGHHTATAAVIQDSLRPLLLGRDPLEVTPLWEAMHSRTKHFGQKGVAVCAISGVDVALWDLKGRIASLPVAALLGGAFRSVIPLYAGGLYYRRGQTLDDLSAEARAYAARGFKAMKMKIGALPPVEDLARMRTVREALGDEILLMVDANRGYDFVGACEIGREIEKMRLYWFEEPLPPEEVEGYTALRQRLRVLIAGGETEFTAFGFDRMFTAGALDIAQPDICLAGGFTECLRIAALARVRGVRIIPHMHGTAVGLTAGLQFVAALPGWGQGQHGLEPWMELDMAPNPLREDLLTEPLDIRGAEVRLPKKPGLGVEVNMDVLNRYRVR